ncbi:hypothetical protein [Oceanobacillus jeddahense]|uniref:hypothetical protein n=1 Tax=Oceanobacillus jeddahense TaxID=1462527 RepID=UPI000595F1AE|nr:hypothetical protein [Oceanobacillus jeddahense]
MNKPTLYITIMVILFVIALLNFLFVYPFLLIQYTIYILIIAGFFFNMLFSLFAVRKRYPFIIVANALILLLLCLFVIFIYFIGEGGYPPAIDLFNNEINV